MNRIISPIFLLSNKCAIHFCREATKQNKQVWKPKTWLSYSYLARQRFQGYRILHATKYIWGGKSLLHLFNVIIYFFCFYFKTLKRYLIFKYLFLIKGTVKEKWKGVMAETWESQVFNDTYKTSIWCSCLEKLI